MALFAGFGLFHGAAFGGSIAGQEGGVGGVVLIGYLIGLGAIQYGIALAAGWVRLNACWAQPRPPPVNARLAGAMVAGVGAFLVLERCGRPGSGCCLRGLRPFQKTITSGRAKPRDLPHPISDKALPCQQKSLPPLSPASSGPARRR